jgi:orotidine-5'-phosphate decarboxylase
MGILIPAENELDFIDKLTKATQKNNSLLCVGLDPDPELMPGGVSVFDFNKAIIDATADLVCAYKLNFAFYEVLEDEGLEALKRTAKYIPDGIIAIGDAKRGDIANTAKAYAKSIFVNYEFDATTVNPYLGFDSIEPFLKYQDRGVFVLCRTSNAGATDFQSLNAESDGNSLPLYEIVARKVSQWNKYGNLGLVVGATYPEELKTIRQNHPTLPLLIPGIGAQGGDLAPVVKYGVNKQGERAIINSSRQIIYASKGKDFAVAARRAAAALRDQINAFRGK